MSLKSSIDGASMTGWGSGEALHPRPVGAYSPGLCAPAAYSVPLRPNTWLPINVIPTAWRHGSRPCCNRPANESFVLSWTLRDGASPVGSSHLLARSLGEFE